MSNPNELVISPMNRPPVAFGMTGASFDGAQRQGVVSIEADVDAMAYIAQRVGYVSEAPGLTPLVLIARAAEEQRQLIARWDERLPLHAGMPSTGRFFGVNHLTSETPASANRDLFVRVARRIGAPALTEITVPSWVDDTTHAGDFATGLLLGQRPLDLPPKPSLLRAVGNAVTPVSNKKLQLRDMVYKDPKMPKPFIIKTRQLEIGDNTDRPPLGGGDGRQLDDRDWPPQVEQ